MGNVCAKISHDCDNNIKHKKFENEIEEEYVPP